MPTGRKVGLLPALLAGLLCFAANAQAPLPPDPPPSSAGIFPLAQVRAGMHGVAYTVFQGSEPEPMGVEILGVLRHALGPGEDMILARLTGPKAEYTGVVAGMSGSPVYLDGRLLGALAFRIGQFSKEPIAGITPIERMLEVRDWPSAAKEPLLAAAAGTTGDLRPIEAPLVLTGYGADALALWKEHAPAGLEAVAGLGGSSSPASAAATVKPGSAVSALLVEGDLEIAATCTVTYVDPKRLLACGHPLTQFGDVSLPMTQADVVATLPSPLNAFKIVNTGQVIGAWTQDRQTAIGGLLGEQARMIPVTIHVTSAEPGSAERILRLRVLDQAQLTPTAVMVSFFQALQQANSSGGEDSFRVRGSIQVSQNAPVLVDDFLAPSEGGVAAGLQAAIDLGQRFSRLYEDPARRVPIDGVELWAERIPKHLTAEIARVSVDRVELRAGEPVDLAVTLRPWRGEPRVMRVRCTVPASVASGEVRLLVSDGGALDRLATGRGSQPTELSGTVAQLNALHASDRVYVTLLDPAAQIAVEGRVLGQLPDSVANAYQALKGPQGVVVNGESMEELTSEAAGAAVSGQQVVTLRIE